MRNQKAVTAYLKSNPVLPFGIARQYGIFWHVTVEAVYVAMK